MTNATAAYIYKCSNGHTMRIEAADVTALLVTIEIRIDAAHTAEGHRMPCAACGELLPVYGQQIKATYSAAKRCDSRCTMATGKSCTCECGGKNHSGDYRISA